MYLDPGTPKLTSDLFTPEDVSSSGKDEQRAGANDVSTTAIVEVYNSSLESDLYHFKVMELDTFEDTGNVNRCHLKFHFFHRLIRQEDPEDADSPRSNKSKRGEGSKIED